MQPHRKVLRAAQSLRGAAMFQRARGFRHRGAPQVSSLRFHGVFSALRCKGGAVVEPLNTGLPSFAIHSPESISLM